MDVPRQTAARRSGWIDRLSPSLVDGGLLPELIGLIADYATALPLRWSPTLLGYCVSLTGVPDEDGCTREVSFNEVYPTGTLSHEPLCQFVRDQKDSGLVRWGFVPERTADPRAKYLVCGVARVNACLDGKTFGVDDKAWGVRTEQRYPPMSVHDGNIGSAVEDSTGDMPRIIWCTADLRTDTLTFEGQFAKALRVPWPELTWTIPNLGECHAFVSKHAPGRVRLVFPGERWQWERMDDE
jgi:hypothetical protein